MSGATPPTLGAVVMATDARGVERRGTITYGPARDRDGIRGKFVKVWIRFDGRDDEIPWPLESVRWARIGELDGDSSRRFVRGAEQGGE